MAWTHRLKLVISFVHAPRYEHQADQTEKDYCGRCHKEDSVRRGSKTAEVSRSAGTQPLAPGSTGVANAALGLSLGLPSSVTAVQDSAWVSHSICTAVTNAPGCVCLPPLRSRPLRLCNRV